MTKRHCGIDCQTSPPKSLPPPLNGSFQIINGNPITALKELTWRKQSQGSPLCKGKRSEKPHRQNPKPLGSQQGIQMWCVAPLTVWGTKRPACALQFSKLLATLMKSVGTLVWVLCYLERCLLLELVHAW